MSYPHPNAHAGAQAYPPPHSSRKEEEARLESEADFSDDKGTLLDWDKLRSKEFWLRKKLIRESPPAMSLADEGGSIRNRGGRSPAAGKRCAPSQRIHPLRSTSPSVWQSRGAARRCTGVGWLSCAAARPCRPNTAA